MHPLVLKIEKRLAEYEEDLPKGCTQAEIDALVSQSRQQLDAVPPAEYLDFLKDCNGLVFNGLTIFSSSEEGDADIEGFVDENLSRYRGDLEGFERTLVFAEDSLGFYALNVDTGIYRVESFGGIVTREYKTFRELIDYALSTVTKDLP